MSQRLLQLDDVRDTNSPDRVADLFQKLGYNATRSAQPLAVKELELPDRSADVIKDSYLIADHQKGATNSLQVLLFQLHLKEWETPSTASNRMRVIAQSLCRRPSKFLLVGTQNYKQLMLVNPRTSLDAQMNVKTTIRKLLIDRTNPTPYDRDRLEAISARDLDPLTLYNRQCDAFDVEKLTKEFYDVTVQPEGCSIEKNNAISRSVEPEKMTTHRIAFGVASLVDNFAHRCRALG